MATGDIVWFEEARTPIFFAGFSTTDDIKLAICDNTVAPTAAHATPSLDDFTEVTAAGSYTTGGTSLGTWTAVWAEVSGTATMDSATNPMWPQNASNDVDAYWGIIYNDTLAGNLALMYVDLGGPVDMSAGSLTVTWSGTGIATITAA